jgi:holo-[acyl-carrier protein] synthase
MFKKPNDSIRWAAKEAVFKACYPSLKLTWKQVETWKAGPKPMMRLLLDIPKEQSPQLHLSISHDGEYIVGYVVAEMKD